MKQNDIDTKITNALISLMSEKDYKSISITDIVNKAGLSRVTYYRHFNTKEDILIRYFELTKNRFVEQTMSAGTMNADSNEVIILALFLYFKANMNANKCLRKAGLDGELLKFLSEEFLDNLPIKLEKYTAICIAGGLFNVLINWLDNDCKDPIDEVSKPFIEIQESLKNKLNK